MRTQHDKDSPVSDDYVQSYGRNFGFMKDYSREAAFLDRVFKVHGHAVDGVLDIACGPGDHIRELALMGYRCAAADIDPDMLALTQRAAADEGVRIATHVVDMRDFRLDGRFDAALNMFYSFQNVLFSADEQARFFKGVSALLPTGGLFVIELLPEENNLRQYPPGQSFVTHRAREDDGSTVTVTTTNRILDDTTKEIVFDYETVWPDGRIEHEEMISPIRRVRLAEFDDLAAAARFETVGAYGDCALDTPFGEESAKLVAVLKKA